MTRRPSFLASVLAGFEKQAATDSKSKSKKNDTASLMPPSPIEIENESLSDQLENIQLKMQLRQAIQAQQAVAQQDQQAAEEQAQQEQMAQMQQMGMDPNGGAGMGGMNPATQAGTPALPTSPTDMIGAQ